MSGFSRPIRILSTVQKVNPVNITSGHQTLQQRLHSTVLPFPRSGHRIVVTEYCLYIVGGYNPELWDHEQEEDPIYGATHYPLFHEIWRLNLLTRKWHRLQTKGPMPTELASHAATIFNDYLLVVGGTGVPFGHSSSNDIYSLNLRTCEWKRLPCTGSFPQKQYGHGMVRSDSKLYVVGGTTGFMYNMEVHQLDLTSPTLCWHNYSRSPEPPPRYRHEIAFHRDNLFVFAGGTSEVVYPLDDINVFSLHKSAWTTRRTVGQGHARRRGSSNELSGEYPKPRRCHALVTYRNHSYVIGGYDGQQIFNDIWRLNLDTLEWRKISTLPEPVFFHDAAVTPDGRLFIFGGVTHTNNQQRTSNVYRSFLVPPTLKLAATEKLFAAFPGLLATSESKLIVLGVPRDVIDWATDKAF